MGVPLAFHFPAPKRGGTHTHGATHPWEINIPDHPKRKESKEFRAAKKLAKKILETIGVDERFLGSESLQMHHGGSLWVLDDEGWFLLQNQAGIEWSGQFCADPAKVNELRLYAVRLYRAFPKSIPKMIELGYKDAQKILSTPVTDAETVAVWVDSIFNSCVPLPAVRHVGIIRKGGAGRHHYPTPITDIDLIKMDDFELFVTDPESGETAAVVPVAKRGMGVSKVNVVYAAPGTALAEKQAEAESKGEPLELDEDQSLTQQAFVNQ